MNYVCLTFWNDQIYWNFYYYFFFTNNEKMSKIIDLCQLSNGDILARLILRFFLSLSIFFSKHYAILIAKEKKSDSNKIPIYEKEKPKNKKKIQSTWNDYLLKRSLFHKEILLSNVEKRINISEGVNRHCWIS